MTYQELEIFDDLLTTLRLHRNRFRDRSTEPVNPWVQQCYIALADGYAGSLELLEEALRKVTSL